MQDYTGTLSLFYWRVKLDFIIDTFGILLWHNKISSVRIHFSVVHLWAQKHFHQHMPSCLYHTLVCTLKVCSDRISRLTFTCSGSFGRVQLKWIYCQDIKSAVYLIVIWLELSTSYVKTIIDKIECEFSLHLIIYSLKEELNSMDGWLGGWMVGRTDGYMDEWMDGWKDEWIDGWNDEWMRGRGNRWVEGWVVLKKSIWQYIVTSSLLMHASIRHQMLWRLFWKRNITYGAVHNKANRWQLVQFRTNMEGNSEKLFPPPVQLKAKIWEFFGFLQTPGSRELDMSHAICKLCRNKVKYCSSSTNLRLHVTRRHADQPLATSTTQRVSSQPTLNEAFNLKCPSTSQRAKKITNALVCFICKDLRPYSVVDRTLVRQVVQYNVMI